LISNDGISGGSGGGGGGVISGFSSGLSSGLIGSGGGGRHFLLRVSALLFLTRDN
jgi:hypothetical protein